MIPIKVYASSIANLSDARYFAGQGAEIISFQLNASMSIDQIKEIMSWVEVPYFALEIEDLQWSDDLFEKISTLHPQIIVLPLFWKDNKEFGDYKNMKKVMFYIRLQSHRCFFMSKFWVFFLSCPTTQVVTVVYIVFLPAVKRVYKLYNKLLQIYAQVILAVNLPFVKMLFWTKFV